MGNFEKKINFKQSTNFYMFFKKHVLMTKLLYYGLDMV